MEKFLVLICIFGASITGFSQNSKALKLYNEAISILQEGEESMAISKLEQALDIDSNFIKARYNLGLLYREMQRLDLADKHFSAIIRLQPTFPKAYVLRGKIRLEAMRLQDALNDFVLATQMFPYDYDAWHGSGALCLLPAWVASKEDTCSASIVCTCLLRNPWLMASRAAVCGIRIESVT